MKIIKVAEYYDSIAEEYDQKMDTEDNKSIRSWVSEYFTKLPDIKNILDFGAGTGADLPWQLKKDYDIIFYEPSVKMASVAIKKYDLAKNKKITLLVGQDASLKNLQDSVEIKLDGILSNFSALNSIKDLTQYFGIFSEKLKENGHFVCIVTNITNFKERLKIGLKNVFFKKSNLLIHNKNGEAMEIYSHSKRKMIKLGRKSRFELVLRKKMPAYGFTLYHFRKI